MMKKIIFSILFILSILPISSQNITKMSFNGHILNYKAAVDSIYTFDIDSSVSGLVLSIDISDSFNGSFVVVKGDTIFLQRDDNNEGDEDANFSNLISFGVQVRSFQFYPGDIKKEIVFNYIHARLKKSGSDLQKSKKKSTVCSPGEMIEQSVWRQGLPDPEYQRINQKVYHVIIHHTADLITDTNYTQIVRNIYVYHTEGRGWSDIGYNYLIAPDGKIYKGRDPDIFDQDNVMGAHFCNANSGTMGISMIGTYTDVLPTDTAFHSLIHLITWKLGKDHLNPFGTYYHALNPELPAIAGHRDGCATECPGNALYPLMDSIRNEVLAEFNECGYFISSIHNESPTTDKLTIYYEESFITIKADETEILFVEVYDLTGRLIPVRGNFKERMKVELQLNQLPKGIYILVCKTREGYLSSKLPEF